MARYAATDGAETIAELWTEFKTSPTPRDPAKFVGEYITNALSGPR